MKWITRSNVKADRVAWPCLRSLPNTLNCCGKVVARAFLRRPAMETSTAAHDWLLEEVAGLFDMKKDKSAAW